MAAITLDSVVLYSGATGSGSGGGGTLRRRTSLASHACALMHLLRIRTIKTTNACAVFKCLRLRIR